MGTPHSIVQSGRILHSKVQLTQSKPNRNWTSSVPRFSLHERVIHLRPKMVCQCPVMLAGRAAYSSMFAKALAMEVPWARLQTDQKLFCDVSKENTHVLSLEVKKREC